MTQVTSEIFQMLTQLPTRQSLELGESLKITDCNLIYATGKEYKNAPLGICDQCDDGDDGLWLSPVDAETSEAAIWDALQVAAELRGALEQLLESGALTAEQFDAALDYSRHLEAK